MQKYTLAPPFLVRDAIHISSEGEIKVDISDRFDYDVRNRDGPHYVPGSYVTVAIPFDGDATLFGCQPSAYTLSPPRGHLEGSTVLISFQGVNLDPHRTRQAIDATVGEIEKYLKWIKDDCQVWNARVQAVAEQCVRDRKRRLLEQANMLSALGLPMKRRPDAADVISVPVARKKRPIVLPPTPKEAFKPEPALPDTEYDFILAIIDRLSQSIERSRSTFVHMKEE